MFLCFYVYITGCIKEWLGDAEHFCNLFQPLPWLPFLQSNEKRYANNFVPLSNQIAVLIPLQNNNYEVTSALLLYIHISHYLKSVFYVLDITFFYTLYTFSNILIIQQSHEVFIIVIPPFERAGKWSSGKLDNSSMVIRRVGVRASTQFCRTPKPIMLW